jgi:hypothetical protein
MTDEGIVNFIRKHSLPMPECEPEATWWRKEEAWLEKHMKALFQITPNTKVIWPPALRRRQLWNRACQKRPNHRMVSKPRPQPQPRLRRRICKCQP